jgi:hypothetical protein
VSKKALKPYIGERILKEVITVWKPVTTGITFMTF